MQHDFYGLRGQPFQITPDARLFFASAGHARAQAHLAYGLEQREGFVVITGEVGAGKTTLIERLCSQLDPRGFTVARIVTTQLCGDDVLRLAADAFGVPPAAHKADLLRGINAALGTARRRHLLIVDEAQGLPPSALEELRMLSNITHSGRPPMQTILMGQPQLRRMMASPDLEQLRQRVVACYHLRELALAETHAYVTHRLRAVGWTGWPEWTPDALDMVHHHSGGVPRRINRLCARVLLAGALEHVNRLDGEFVEATALELEDDLGGPPAPPAPETDTFEALRQRIATLEEGAPWRERVMGKMQRIADLLPDREPR